MHFDGAKGGAEAKKRSQGYRHYPSTQPEYSRLRAKTL